MNGLVGLNSARLLLKNRFCVSKEEPRGQVRILTSSPKE